MSVQIPLYNSRLTKIYIQYLGKYYPNISTAEVLKDSGIANYEVEDPAHWFTQEQVDRFHEVITQKTGNTNISREVGRFAAYSEGMGAAKQYILGLMSPGSLYLLMEKHYPVLSRGVSISAKKIGPDTVELFAVPKPGVAEKLFEEERVSVSFRENGTQIRAGAALFNNKADIDHLLDVVGKLHRA